MRRIITIILAAFLTFAVAEQTPAQSLLQTVKKNQKKATQKKSSAPKVMKQSNGSRTSSGTSLMNKAKRKQQEVRERKERELNDYNYVVESRDLALYEAFIAEYPKSNNTAEIKKRAAEIRLWGSASNADNIAAYRDYLSKTQYHWYDDEAKNRLAALKREQEKEEWNKVKRTNTIEAYQAYLRNNPDSGYKEEAEKAMEELEAAQLWGQLKNSVDTADLLNFISKYPDSACTAAAKERFHELKGVEFYNAGNLNSAYNEFSHIKRDKLSHANRQIYDELAQYKEFSYMSELTSENELQAFLNKYPNSKYRGEVNNLIAVAKAKVLGDNATEYDYMEALRYATDNKTKTRVEGYISQNKSMQKERKRQLRAYKRKQNGGLFNIGFDFIDMGYNCNNDKTIFYYDIGLMFRIGNYADWGQFAVGIKPGLIGYDAPDYYSSYSDSNFEAGFHMPIIGQLKLNLFKMSETSRFFIFGQFQYNAVRINEAETPMSWGVGLGFGWKHFDWSFYYRQDHGTPSEGFYSSQQPYIGMSMIYYWNL